MHIGYLRMRPHMPYELIVILGMLNAHIRKCGDVHSYLFIVDHGGVLLYHTAVFELSDALDHRGLGKMYFLGYVCDLCACIQLQYS